MPPPLTPQPQANPRPLPGRPVPARPVTPPTYRAPDAYPDMPWSATDRQWLTRLSGQDPAAPRPAFPYGRDLEATRLVGAAMATPHEGTTAADQVASAERLRDYVHGHALRGGILQAAGGDGYPVSSFGTPATGTYARGLDRAYPFAWPRPTGSHQTGYDPVAGTVLLEEEPMHQVSPSVLGVYRHEMEHGLQGPLPDWQFVGPEEPRRIERAPGTVDRLLRQVADLRHRLLAGEVGPSLGDALWTSRDHQSVTGRPLRYTVEFPNGVAQSLPWMTRQAQQHGLYDGRSMTELLATPSGQQYIRHLASPSPPDLAPDGAPDLLEMMRQRGHFGGAPSRSRAAGRRAWEEMRQRGHFGGAGAP